MSTVQERKPIEIKLASDGEVVLDYTVESNGMAPLKGNIVDSYDNFSGSKVNKEVILKSVFIGAALFFVGRAAYFYFKNK